MEIFKAHRQWAKRPKDETFNTLEEAYAASKRYAETAVERTVPFSVLRTEALGPDVVLVGKGETPATLTNFSFGQLAARVKAPADYLRNLPPTLAVQNLNYGLANRLDGGRSGQAELLFQHPNGSLLCRAITTDKYSRIWNYEVIDRMQHLTSFGWEPARPTFRNGPDDHPALYVSDHDMFAFLMLKNVALDLNVQRTHTAPIYRGVIVENSEVGAGSLALTKFFFNEMCGNHIIWGATEVVELRIRHIGDARGRMRVWDQTLRRYAESSVSDEAALIESAQRTKIAATKEEVLDKLFGIRSLGIGKKVLEASFESVKPSEDGDPRTVWGMVQGITRHSQTIPYADKRTELDTAAGKLLAHKF